MRARYTTFLHAYVTPDFTASSYEGDSIPQRYNRAQMELTHEEGSLRNMMHRK